MAHSGKSAGGLEQKVIQMGQDRSENKSFCVLGTIRVVDSLVEQASPCVGIYAFDKASAGVLFPFPSSHDRL